MTEESSPPPKEVKPSRKEQREKKKFDFERNNRTIFIGNLPSSYDHRDVAKLFKACGPVESARIRSVIPEKEKLSQKVAQITKRIHPKIDSVNAYLVFEKSDDNEEHIKKALAINGRVVDEHHIRVDRAQHPNSKRMTLTSRKKSIFVGNLRFDLRDDDLTNHFEKVGPVDYVRLVRDRATGLGKGFGFVKFQDRASVKKALELNDSQFKGRALRIKKVDEQALKMGEDRAEGGGASKRARSNEGDSDNEQESSPSKKKQVGGKKAAGRNSTVASKDGPRASGKFSKPKNDNSIKKKFGGGGNDNRGESKQADLRPGKKFSKSRPDGGFKGKNGNGRKPGGKFSKVKHEKNFKKKMERSKNKR